MPMMATFSHNGRAMHGQSHRSTVSGSYHRIFAHGVSRNSRALSSVRHMSGGEPWCAAQSTFSLSQQKTMREGHSSDRRSLVVVAGNPGSNGPFAPLVRVARNIIGTKDFNKIRGKAISLHSQVIKDFCKQIGVDQKQIQGLIRLAKKNGEKLGFLA